MPRKHRWPDPQIEEPDSKRVDREGKRLVGAHFDYPIVVEIRHLKSDHDLNTTDLLLEAVALVFIKYGKSLPPALKEELRISRARRKRGSGD